MTWMQSTVVVVAVTFVGIPIGQARPDQLAGPGDSVLGRGVGARPIACAFGRARDQGVADVQGQTQLKDGQKQQAQKPGDHGEIGDSRTGFVGGALTVALTVALTLKLALNGPVASDAPNALTHLAQISQTSTQEAKPDGLAQPRCLSG
jgi:hypothetical protein